MPGSDAPAGYAEAAEELIARYEAIRFEDVHAAVIALFPKPPGAVLDIGAGPGRDAGALALKGFHVTAIEPTAAFRAYGRKAHPPAIRWVDDRLPALTGLSDQPNAFDIVLITAVWMHLETQDRPPAMKAVAHLLKPGGRLFMSLRHGPAPEGRIMFDVAPEETIALAESNELQTIACIRNDTSLQSCNRQAGITWSKLVFEKPS